MSFKVTKINIKETRLIAGTASPITAPPKNPVRKVAENECLAALAVLELALTATFIPTYPANRERSTPQTKAKEVIQLKNKKKIRANQGITRKIVRNCLLR
jgi:hypothetical protein